LATDRDLATSCKMGCVAAGEVIRHIGPRPETPVAEMFAAAGLV